MMKSSIRMTEAKEAPMDIKKEAMPKKLLIDNIKWIRETIKNKKSKNKKTSYKKRTPRGKSMVMVKQKRLSRNKHIGWINQSHKPRMARKEKRNETIFPIKFQSNFCMYINLNQ